ncbi:MAG TPA: DUF6445 family protein [Sphingomicrobium sp.]|jgi:hypothetical protein
MFQFLWVIDDFLGNADQVRDHALSLTYSRTGTYPGRGSIEQLPIRGLQEEISSIVRQPLSANWPANHAHATCRLTLAQDNEEARIHVDPNHLSGLLYLSRPEDCRGGTEFFRHKRTGTDRMPTTLKGLQEMGYSSYDELEADLLHKDGGDRSKWERTMEVPMRFNRLVLLHPYYWHTAGPGFGDSLENGRLVYLLFFERAPAHVTSRTL